MAIKNFMLIGSYSRIEKVSVTKESKQVDYSLSVYADDTLSAKIAELKYGSKNDPFAKKCPDCECGYTLTTIKRNGEEVKENVACVRCNATGFIADNDYANNFEEALKLDLNIISLCYKQLKKRIEFKNTEEC